MSDFDWTTKELSDLPLFTDPDFIHPAKEKIRKPIDTFSRSTLTEPIILYRFSPRLYDLNNKFIRMVEARYAESLPCCCRLSFHHGNEEISRSTLALKNEHGRAMTLEMLVLRDKDEQNVLKIYNDSPHFLQLKFRNLNLSDPSWNMVVYGTQERINLIPVENRIAEITVMLLDVKSYKYIEKSQRLFKVRYVSPNKLARRHLLAVRSELTGNDAENFKLY
jgi:hypothetical protein